MEELEVYVDFYCQDKLYLVKVSDPYTLHRISCFGINLRFETVLG